MSYVVHLDASLYFEWCSKSKRKFGAVTGFSLCDYPDIPKWVNLLTWLKRYYDGTCGFPAPLDDGHT